MASVLRPSEPSPDLHQRDVSREPAAGGRVLEVEDLQTYFYTRAGLVKAVDGVSFSLRRGETLAIVGESGCGKSVTALSLMRLVADPPGRIVGGSIRLDGVDLADAYARWCPETALVLRGGEPGPACDRLAANWRRLQPLSLLLLSRPMSEQVAILDELVRVGFPYRDPAWRLPRSSRR